MLSVSGYHEYQDFVAQLLQADPAKRPSAATLLKHKFIRSAKKQGTLIEIAKKAIAFLTEQKKFARPIVTQIEKASVFYPAEGYHQDYLVKNPAGYNCHVLREW